MSNNSNIEPRIWSPITQVTDYVDIDDASLATTEWHYAMDGYELTECTQDVHNAGIFEVLAMTFGIAIFLTNLIVVAAIKRGGRKLHKATFYCICNLAVADMLAGLLLLWIFGLQREVLMARTPLSELVQKSVWTLTVWTSLLSQVVIAVDRYSHVTRGSKGDTSFPRGCDKWGNKKRRRMIIGGILLTWVIPTVTFVIPVMTIWNCRDSCSCYVTTENKDVIYMVCLPVASCSQINPPFAKSSMLFLSLVLLLLPFVPVILYLKIFFFVRNSSRNLCPPGGKGGHIVVSVTDTDNGWHTKRDSHGKYSRDENSISKTEALVGQDEYDEIQKDISVCERIGQTNAGQLSKKKRISTYFNGRVTSVKSNSAKRNGIALDNGEQHNGRDHAQQSIKFRSASSNNALRKRSQRRDMRLLRTLVIILGLFVISTVPLGLLFLISVTETDKQYVKSAKYLLTLSLLNSLVNPWVYFWRFREMRHAIRRLFCSPCSRKRKIVSQRDEKTCVCCPLPKGRKMFNTTNSSKKGGSSSKDQSSSSAF